MKQLLSSLLISVALLSSCASVDASKQALQKSKECCVDVAGLPYKPVSLNEIVSVEITENSPLFKFPEGKSFFAAFTIPKQVRSRVIDFTVGSDSPWVPSVVIFMPKFLFLGDDFHPIAVAPQIEVRQGQLHFQERFVSGIAWSGRVEIPDEAVHVVLYTPESNIGQTIVFREHDTGRVFMSGTTPVYSPGSGAGRRDINLGGTGLIKLRVNAKP